MSRSRTGILDMVNEKTRKCRCCYVVGIAQVGQTHGAGVVTGRGLRLRHLAQRYRLPLTAVLGRDRLPVRSSLSPMSTIIPTVGQAAILTRQSAIGSRQSGRR